MTSDNMSVVQYGCETAPLLLQLNYSKRKLNQYLIFGPFLLLYYIPIYILFSYFWVEGKNFVCTVEHM